ncbi:MAG TPA: hypothetical protein VJZ71_02090 [Phycisphaerae bacterium]|nr:hypothetical protein [Phycisphaerae bacterium]
MIAPDHIAPVGPIERTSRGAILLIVLLAAALRLIALDRVPPAINQDEAVNAYDAYCLLKTGTDHYGTPWPVFFRSFGDYHPGIPIYLQIPFQAILGLNVWSTRLPDALFGTALVLWVFLLVRRFYGDGVGLLSAAFLAVSPWHIHLSRLAFGIGISTSLTTLGLLLIARRIGGKSASKRFSAAAYLELAGAGVALGAASWTYHAMRAVVPLLLAGGILLNLGRLRTLARTPGGIMAGAAMAGGLAVGTFPFFWTWAHAPQEVWARASSLSPFHQSADWFAAMKLVIHNYSAHFTPSFLFLEGDHSLVQSIPGYGELHHVYALFLPFGLYRVIRHWRTERFGRFVLWWIVIAPIPAALARLDTPSGHCLRAAGVLPAYDILAAMGADLLVRALARRFRRAATVAAALVLAPMALGTAYFGYQFFFRYPDEAALYFNGDWGPIITDIERRRTSSDAVIITNIGNGHISAHYLFWSKTDPIAYFKARPNIVTGPEADFLIQVGTTFFTSAQRIDEVVAVLRPGTRLFVVERPGLPVPGNVLKQFLDRKGNPMAVLYEVRTQ